MAYNLNIQLFKQVKFEQVKEFLLSENFQVRGKNKFKWFIQEDMQSLGGVYVYYNTLSREDRRVLPRGVKLMLNVATYFPRSWEDMQKQLDTVQKLQDKFQGQIYNPQLKDNSLPENTLAKLSHPEKKLGLVIHHFYQRLDNLQAFAQVSKTLDWQEQEQENYQQNLQIPFLISIFESFYYELFVTFLEQFPHKLEENLKRRYKLRLNFFDLKNLLDGKKSLAQWEAENYSFQNLYLINLAYGDFLEVWPEKIWSKMKKIKGERVHLWQVLDQVLKLRHLIVHQAFVQENLSEKSLLQYIEVVSHTAKLLISQLERKYKLQLEFDKVLQIETTTPSTSNTPSTHSSTSPKQTSSSTKNTKNTKPKSTTPKSHSKNTKNNNQNLSLGEENLVISL